MLKQIRQATVKVARYKEGAILRFAEHEKIETYEASLEELLTKAGKMTTERRSTNLTEKGEERGMFTVGIVKVD